MSYALTSNGQVPFLSASHLPPPSPPSTSPPPSPPPTAPLITHAFQLPHHAAQTRHSPHTLPLQLRVCVSQQLKRPQEVAAG